MSAVDKLLFFARSADQVVVSGTFELALIAWLLRTLLTSRAMLWPSGFGDNGPLVFDRTDEPREFWALVCLAACALAFATFVLVHRLIDIALELRP
ncbi:hypothetical protein HJG53_07075 [Sphingomonas sp. ID1715]|uniref:hypothetical protein n=1 Tax=Sphingomonas sp. ID1715 TaxID=1656898 RepID=UPI00148995CC|nr:hypothetical protein [Sphingomonas sp. ID1715]NNM76660.1 hypothetical protein [Sphingomonas sp. ID1715]